MNNDIISRKGERVVDEFDNELVIGDTLSRGGQGIVFKAKRDPDIAIKQPIDSNTGQLDYSADYQLRFLEVRCLPIPENIHIALPMSILKNEPGYVMRLLNGMAPLSRLSLNGEEKEHYAGAPTGEWLEGLDADRAALLLHYAETGSTKSRLRVLYRCAVTLSRLHFAGLVYNDLSPNNIFYGEDGDVWLIDSDNIRYEYRTGGETFLTYRYGAPELVQVTDSARPCTDIWSFAVIAFETLALVHPFIGKKVLNPEEEIGGWDCDTEAGADDPPSDLDDQAYSGYLPYIDDIEDDSNEGVTGLPRELVLTPMMRRLFQQTLGDGRLAPWKRSSMVFWALSLAQAHDTSLSCPKCGMSYYLGEEECPYCGGNKPDYAIASTSNWDMVIQGDTGEYQLPHRLLFPFSVSNCDEVEYEVIINFEDESAAPARGFGPLPDGLNFAFVRGRDHEV